jgi:hypothetical protein
VEKTVTEDLLAFVTVIAIWKIIQVWVLKWKLKKQMKSTDALRRELNYNVALLETVTTFDSEPQPRLGTFHR